MLFIANEIKERKLSFYVYTSLSAFPFFFLGTRRKWQISSTLIWQPIRHPLSAQRGRWGVVWGRGSNSYMC